MEHQINIVKRRYCRQALTGRTWMDQGLSPAPAQSCAIQAAPFWEIRSRRRLEPGRRTTIRMKLLRSFRKRRGNIPRPNRRARTSGIDRNLAHIGSSTGAAGLPALLLKSPLVQSGKALQCRLFTDSKKSMPQGAHRNIPPWSTAADLHSPSRGLITPGLPVRRSHPFRTRQRRRSKMWAANAAAGSDPSGKFSI